MADDVALLEAWRGGDKLAGNELIERHFDALYRFFRNKVSDGVEDLVQRTLLSCVESSTKIRESASFRAYLYAIARNELYDHYRRTARAREMFDPGVTTAFDLGPSPSRLVADQQQQRLLVKALRRIPVAFQLILELHYWEQLSTAELAEAIGVPPGTVKSRLRRGRELLKARLAELAQTPDTLESTIGTLDDWIASLREFAGPVS